MSKIKVVWLSCDNCQEASGDDSLEQSTTVEEARQRARSDGWHRTMGGRDICPCCWAEGAR